MSIHIYWCAFILSIYLYSIFASFGKRNPNTFSMEDLTHPLSTKTYCYILWALLNNITWSIKHLQQMIYSKKVCFCVVCNGSLPRYAKLRVVHASGMPETFSPPLRVSDPDMHHGTCVTHVPWCMPGSLASGFLWSRWQGKRSRYFRRMRNPQFYVSGKSHVVVERPAIVSCFAAAGSVVIELNRIGT